MSELSRLDPNYVTVSRMDPSSAAPAVKTSGLSRMDPNYGGVPEVAAGPLVNEKPTGSNPALDFVKGFPENTGKFVQETIGGGINTAKYIAHDVQTFSLLPKAEGPANGLRVLSQEFRKAIGVPVTPEEQKALATDVAIYQKSNNVDPKIIKRLNELLADQPTVEERQSTDRGLATIAATVAPIGKVIKVATGPLPSLLVKIAAVEAHGIASMVTWGAGQNIANNEPVQKDLLQNAAIGAVFPPAGAVIGKTVGLGLQGAGKVIGGAGAVAGTAAGMTAKAMLGVKTYVAVRGLLANMTDYVVLNGEQILRKNGLHATADQLMAGRVAQHTQTGEWIAAVTRALGDLSKDDQTLVGQMLSGQISQEQLSKLTKTDPALLADKMEQVRTLGSHVGDLLEQAGVPVFDPRDDSIHRFVKRADWGGMPHVYVNTIRFVTEGDPLRDEAIAVLKKGQGWTEEKAKSFLEGLHARNAGEVTDVMTSGKGQIHGSVTTLGRRYNLPGFEINPSAVLPKYLATSARMLDNITRFGDPARPMPFTYEIGASDRVVAHTIQHNGATFNLDPALSPVATHGFAVALAGKSVPIGEFSAAHVDEIAALAQEFRTKYPGMKITLGTWKDGDAIHIEVGTLMPNRRSAMALGNVAKQQSIARLGRGGTLTNIIKIPANKDAINLTADEAKTVLDSWHQTKVGQPFAKPKDLPKILNVKTLFPRAFDKLEGINSNWQRDMAEGVIARSLGYEHGVLLDSNIKAGLKGVLAFQAVNKLGLSQISQLSQMLSPIAITGFKHSWRDFLTLMRSDPAMEDRIVRSGAILPALIRNSEASMGIAGNEAEKSLKYSGFTFADTFARKYSVIRGWTMASWAAERMTELNNRMTAISPGFEKSSLQKELFKIEKVMVERGLDPKAITARGGVLTEEDFQKAGLKMSTDVNFWSDALSLSPAFENPWLKILVQFKSFVYQQGEFNRKYIIDPALKDGDWAPLAKMLPVAMVGGEVINDVKSFFRGKPRKEATRYLDNILAGISLGWLGDTMVTATDEQKLYSTVAGPTISDGVDLGSGVIASAHGDFTPLGKKIMQVTLPRVIPFVGPMVTPALVNTAFPPKQKAAQ